MSKAVRGTPVRAALRADSALQADVQDGLGAIENAHRGHFDASVRASFDDSLDIDEAFRVGNDQQNRWDYLLGHAPSELLVAVEPHSAKEDEISTVIKKRAAATAQLRGHLRDHVKVAKWLWVASGRVHFANTEKARMRLDQNGIEFVGAKVLPKHLPAATTNAPSNRTRPSNERPRARRSR